MIPEIELPVNPNSDMVICSLGINHYQILLNIMRPTVEHYGKKHKIDTVLLTQKLIPERDAPWDKIVLIHHLLKYYPILMWLDADTIFINTERDIRLDLNPDYVMELCTHFNLSPCFPNTGVWIVKRDERSFELLEDLWSQTDFMNFPWEQGALCKLIGYENAFDWYKGESYRGPTKYTDLIGILSPKWNNKLNADFEEDPYIYHFCGQHWDLRVTEMEKAYRKFLEKSEKQLS